MDYQKLYDNIIKNAKKQNRKKLNKNDIDYVYYENHHILPRCLNGTDDNKNLVLLTVREHFVCHKLLTYIYKDNRKIACAFNYMAFMNKRKYELTSRDYAYAIELIKNIPISEETRKRMQISRKKQKPTLIIWIEKYGIEQATEMWQQKYQKHAKDVKGEKNGMFNKTHTIEARKKISVGRKNKEPWNKGLKIEYKRRNKQKRVICVICDKNVTVQTLIRWHKHSDK